MLMEHGQLLDQVVNMRRWVLISTLPEALTIKNINADDQPPKKSDQTTKKGGDEINITFNSVRIRSHSRCLEVAFREE